MLLVLYVRVLASSTSKPRTALGIQSTTPCQSPTPASPARARADGGGPLRQRPAGCSMHPVGRRAGVPAGVRGAECPPICRAHSGLVPLSKSIYLSM